MPHLTTRILNPLNLAAQRSLFLFGARQTGKSTILRQPVWEPNGFRYSTDGLILYVNLLDAQQFRVLSGDPAFLRRMLLARNPRPQIVIIDEIQKLPFLLDEVHLMIEEYGIHFILSGSSARALKRKGVNLLGGRAHGYSLHPFVSAELGEHFDLLRVLNYGGLPPIFLSETPQEDLGEYVGTYLAEEVAFEGLVRQLPTFSRFLQTAALCNGEHLHFTNLASDAQVKRSTVVDWFDILKDTLLVYELPVWQAPQKRKAVNAGKFYFFDVGVARCLAQASPLTSLQGAEVGRALEHWIFHELKAACDYKKHTSLHTWRSTDKHEVDFILDESWAIEVKAKTHITKSDFKGLRALKEEGACARYSVVCLCDAPQVLDDGIEVLPYGAFLKEVWSGTLG